MYVFYAIPISDAVGNYRLGTYRLDIGAESFFDNAGEYKRR